MRFLVGTLLALLLAGCPLRRGAAPVADADSQCFIPCTPSLSDTGIRWEADPEDAEAWDALGSKVTKDLAGALLTCERRRQYCAGFIDDLKTRGVIRAKPEPASPPKPVTGE